MSSQDLYDRLPEDSAEILLGWREIRAKVHDEFDKATEKERCALLQLFTATMNIAEATIQPADLESFRKTRKEDYNRLIVKESVVGENICAETAYAVTRREIAAGRMSPEDDLAKIAAAVIAAPHLSRAELIAIEAQRLSQIKPPGPRAGGG
jgi:hypothetical protein